MGAEHSKQLKRAKQSSKNAKFVNRAASTASSSGRSTNASSAVAGLAERQQSAAASETFGGKIVVVSKGEPLKDEAQDEKAFLDYLLSHHFSPLLPKNADSIPPNYQQIDSISMANLCKIVQDFLKEKSDLSAKEQHKIYEKIRKIDYVTAFIANLIVEKEKSQNRTIDVFNRIDDLKALAKVYQGDLDRCLKSIETLNGLLDEEQRIEIGD